MIDYPEPPLVSDLVQLRRWELTDLPFVRKAAAVPELLVGTSLPDPYTEAEGRAFIERQWSRAESGEGISLAIEENGASVAVGCTTLMLRRAEIADLGYWLIPHARRRGPGRATVELRVTWQLSELPIRAIEAFVDPANTPYRRILDACGFSNIGTRRHAAGQIENELFVYHRKG